MHIILSLCFQAMKDHYANILFIRHVFVKEFWPCVDIGRANRKAFSKMPQDVQRDVIVNSLNKIIAKADDVVFEILAVSVLPRFAEQLPTQY